jgi:uncharacterized protein (TIGR00369 family)
VQIPPEVMRDLMQTKIPFNQFLGIECTRVEPGFCRLELPFRPEFIGDPLRQALHGGVLSTLIDTCGGAAVWTRVEPTDAVSTIDLRVDYLRPGARERIVAEAEVVRLGNRVGVADVRVFHPSAPERTIATGKGVYNLKRRRASEPGGPAAPGAGDGPGTDPGGPAD